MTSLVEAAGATDEDIKVKYASTVKGWQNVLKNYDGQLTGFQRIDARRTKHAEEAKVLAWLRPQGEAGKAALDEHDTLLALDKAEGAPRARDLVIDIGRGAWRAEGGPEVEH